MAQGNFGYEVTLNDYFPPRKRGLQFRRRASKAANDFKSIIGEEMSDIKPKQPIEDEKSSASFPRTSGLEESAIIPKSKSTKNLWLYGGVAFATLILIFFITKPKKG